MQLEQPSEQAKSICSRVIDVDWLNCCVTVLAATELINIAIFFKC